MIKQLVDMMFTSWEREARKQLQKDEQVDTEFALFCAAMEEFALSLHRLRFGPDKENRS